MNQEQVTNNKEPSCQTCGDPLNASSVCDAPLCYVGPGEDRMTEGGERRAEVGEPKVLLEPFRCDACDDPECTGWCFMDGEGKE